MFCNIKLGKAFMRRLGRVIWGFEHGKGSLGFEENLRWFCCLHGRGWMRMKWLGFEMSG